jgi:hypothetical protein
LLEYFEVGVNVGSGNENIIQVNENSGEMSKKAVHVALKGLSGVAESKWHVDLFKKTKGSYYDVFGMSEGETVTWW